MNIGNERNKPKKGFGKGRIASLLAIAMMALVVSTSAASALPVPPGSSGMYWFEPDPSSASYGNSVTLDIWLNTTVVLFGGSFTIDTDPDTCGEFVVGSFDDDTTTFNMGHAIREFTKHHMFIGFQTAGFVEVPAGVYHIGSFEVLCNSTTPCTTTLDFIPDVPYTYITNQAGDCDTEEQDGTFECIGAPMPNLNVTNKYETLDTVTDTFTVTYTVENIGGATAAASTTSITDGTATLTDAVLELAAGATHTGTVGPFDCPCGTTVTVTVCADSVGVVGESDETDNCMQNDCTCDSCPLPDLDITDKHEEWVDQLAGTYNIVYTVTNIGGADAGASTTSIMVDGVEVATDSVPLLAPSASHTGTLGPYTMSDDSDIIKVCADMNNVVVESDETNNCEENTFGTAPEITVSAPSACVDGTFFVDIEVDPNGRPVYGVQYNLTCNRSVMKIISQQEGTFLNHNGNATQQIINHVPPLGNYALYGLTRQNTILGETTPGVLVRVEFETVGSPLDCGAINLTEVVVSDNEALPLGSTLENDTVCICAANQPPVASGESEHKYNNYGMRSGLVTLNGSESSADTITWDWTMAIFGSGMILNTPAPAPLTSGCSYKTPTEVLGVWDSGGLSDTDTFTINVYIEGDANGDCVVNVLDASMTGLRWMKTCDDYAGVCWGMMLPTPAPQDLGAEMADQADLNNDCVVNVLDTSIVGLNWGKCCSTC